jgi:hypothetical protein
MGLRTGCAFGFTFGNEGIMKDIQIHLEKLRKEAAECFVVSNLATDPERRELFARVGGHLQELASGVQNAMAAEPANEASAEDTKVVDSKEATTTRRMLPWVLVLVLLTAAGAFVWARAERAPSPVTALETKAEPPPAPQEDIKEAIAKILSAEEEKRRLLTEQLGTLAARIDNLEKARAEVVEPTTRRDAETPRQPRHRKTGAFNW